MSVISPKRSSSSDSEGSEEVGGGALASLSQAHSTLSSAMSGLIHKLKLASLTTGSPDLPRKLSDDETQRAHRKLTRICEGIKKSPSQSNLSGSKSLSEFSPRSPAWQGCAVQVGLKVGRGRTKNRSNEQGQMVNWMTPFSDDIEKEISKRKAESFKDKRKYIALRDFFKNRPRASSMPDMSHSILKKGLRRHSTKSHFPMKQTSFREHVDVQYFDNNHLVSRGSLKLKGEEKLRMNQRRNSPPQNALNRPLFTIGSSCDEEDDNGHVNNNRPGQPFSVECSPGGLNDPLSLLDNSQMLSDISKVQSAYVYTTTQSKGGPARLPSRSCSHSVTAPTRGGQEAAAQEKKMLRLVIEIQRKCLKNRTIVKALSGGRALMVMVCEEEEGTSSLHQPAVRQYVEKILLPLAIDPYSVTACVHENGVLVIEAPVHDTE